MADIVISGMEMPKDHPVLVFIWPDGRVFPYGLYKSSEWDGVKAVPLPEGHGRLIDADAIAECVRRNEWLLTTEKNNVLLLLRNARTIVPAEGGTENGQTDIQR